VAAQWKSFARGNQHSFRLASAGTNDAGNYSFLVSSPFFSTLSTNALLSLLEGPPAAESGQRIPPFFRVAPFFERQFPGVEAVLYHGISTALPCRARRTWC